MSRRGNSTPRAGFVFWVAIQICAMALSGCAATSTPTSSTAPPLRQLPIPPPVLIPNGTPVRIDPQHPAIVHWEYYPAESKRLNEQGSCLVKLTVGTDGLVLDTTLIISTGYSRLDAACLSLSIGAIFAGDTGWEADRLDHRVADQLEIGGAVNRVGEANDEGV
jgi:TonB family protein